MSKLALVVASALALSACASPPRPDFPFIDGRWVDLTHALGDDNVFWPTADEFKHDTVAYGRTPGGWFYSAYNIQTSEHGGTHMDAPIHFAEGAIAAHDVPVDRLIRPAAVIDVRAASASDPDYLFTVQDVLRHEGAHGKIMPGTIVLFDTGRAPLWPDAARYMGTAERGAEAVARLHFPGLSEEVARFLVDQRRVAAIGLDTPSIDHGQSRDFRAHQVLAASAVPGFENVADMSALPPRGATVIALPTKIRDGSGAPLRIVAWVPNED